MAGVYIHIPFCKSKCHYCDFYSSTALERKEAVLAAIAGELRQRASFLGSETVRTVYFGGGTPSLCTPSELGGLLAIVRERFDTRLEEITAEANPDDLTDDYLAALRNEGIGRLSIGIQSFDDRDLRFMHRRHDAATAIGSVERARKAGFDNLTIDLIYGIPGSTPERWARNLRQAVALDVPHLSAYHLTIEEGTVFGRRASRGEFTEIPAERSREEYDLLEETLAAAGYEHYEISNFARPGFRAVHNSNYWNGTPYLGVGPAAHSFDGGRRRQWNTAHIGRYLEEVPGNRHCRTETLTETMRYNEFVMTALRTAEGVDTERLEERFGARKLQYFITQAKKHLARNTIVRNKSVYYIPSEHFLISDGIIADLFYVDADCETETDAENRQEPNR